MAAFSRAFVKASLTGRNVLNAALTRGCGDNSAMHATATITTKACGSPPKGRHAEAIDHLQVALAEHPDDTRVLFALGNTARALGMNAPAEQFYRMVLALEPERLEALINLANLLRADGNPAWQPSHCWNQFRPGATGAPRNPELAPDAGVRAPRDGRSARCCAQAHYREALALRPGYRCRRSSISADTAEAMPAQREEALFALRLARWRSSPTTQTARFHRATLHL